jgi:hypothetical protein
VEAKDVLISRVERGEDRKQQAKRMDRKEEAFGQSAAQEKERALDKPKLPNWQKKIYLCRERDSKRYFKQRKNLLFSSKAEALLPGRARKSN